MIASGTGGLDVHFSLVGFHIHADDRRQANLAFHKARETQGNRINGLIVHNNALAEFMFSQDCDIHVFPLQMRRMIF